MISNREELSFYIKILCFIDRLVQRMAADPDCAERSLLGISFGEFKDFCLFLNNLDDFQVYLMFI